MHIGIVPAASGGGGGVFQYSVSMLRALDEWSAAGTPTDRDELVAFADGVEPSALDGLVSRDWTVQPLEPPLEERAAAESVAPGIPTRLMRRAGRLARRLTRVFRGRGQPVPADEYPVRPRPDVGRWLNACGVELMVYPYPHRLSFESGVPYVMAIHDLQHRLQPEFPEVASNGAASYREYLFRNGARNATLLLADSEVGKEDILNFYGPFGVAPDRVKILPFLPASYLSTDVSAGERQRVRACYELPERYLFYPAQFWPHKNHARLVRALALLQDERGFTVPLVLSGTQVGDIREQTYQELMAMAQEHNVADRVRTLGYVPDADMSALYAEAVALVMPTFFGPTNIPPLEAWSLGCPVITSDIRGIREQMGDAAVLVDPRSVESIAEGIGRVWEDAELCRVMAERGRKRLAAYTPEDYYRRFAAILAEAKQRVRSQAGRAPDRSNGPARSGTT